MKKSHRVSLDITFDKPVNALTARAVAERLTSGQDFQRIAYEEAIRCGAKITGIDIRRGS